MEGGVRLGNRKERKRGGAKCYAMDSPKAYMVKLATRFFSKMLAIGKKNRRGFDTAGQNTEFRSGLLCLHVCVQQARNRTTCRMPRHEQRTATT